MKRLIVSVAAIVLTLPLGSCDSGPPKHAKNVRVVTRQVPSVLRNTIGAESSIKGLEPMAVSGYGLVVGLNGTGSSDIPLPIRTAMVDEMTKLGVGKESGTLPHVSPDQLLDASLIRMTRGSCAIATIIFR